MRMKRRRSRQPFRSNNAIEFSLRESKGFDYCEKIIQSMQIGVIVFELKQGAQGHYFSLIMANRAVAHMLGLVIEDSIGKSMAQIIPNLHTTDLSQQMLALCHSEQMNDISEIQYYDARIEDRYYALKAFALSHETICLFIEDVQDQKHNENEILFLSYHDQLTGLFNRRYFDEEMRRLRHTRQLPISIIVADVNGLKLINDAFGHQMGDELLRCSAELFKKGCRDDDLLARLGGDEFVFVLPRTDSEEAKRIIDRINALSVDTKIGPVAVSVAFGQATKTTLQESLETVFKRAEDQMYKKKLFESPKVRTAVVQGILATLFGCRPYELEHAEGVSETCRQFAQFLGFSAEEQDMLMSLGYLHDIGKIALDETVLLQPGPLSDDEMNEVKRHCEVGYRVLGNVQELSHHSEYVLYHHEHFDGTGYPRGAKGHEIPLFSRILAIVDAYDAMTHHRSYQVTKSVEEAIEEINRCSGSQFDPELSERFIAFLRHA